MHHIATSSPSNNMYTKQKLCYLIMTVFPLCEGLTPTLQHSSHPSRFLMECPRSALDTYRFKIKPYTLYSEQPLPTYRCKTTFLGWSKDTYDSSSTNLNHVVHGVECVEVPMDIPSIGRVVVLEATAAAQDELVNLALDEESQSDKQLNAGDPYGSVLWPAAYAVAAKIMEDPSYKSTLRSTTVLELGTGLGLVSLALSLAGAKRVIATDYEEIPLRLMEYAAKNLNGVTGQIEYSLLDMRDYESKLPTADLVVAADIMYEPKTGIAMAKRAVEALKLGAKVLVGDSPGRPGRKAFLEELELLGVVKAAFVDTVGYTCSGERHELICGKGSTSVSKKPEELMVAIMELDPKVHLPN